MTLSSNPEAQMRVNDGFAIQLEDDTQLGIGMLIAEDDAGQTLPVATASKIDEARELAAADLRDRARRTGVGEEVCCPTLYHLWARVTNGKYLLASSIEA